MVGMGGLERWGTRKQIINNLASCIPEIGQFLDNDFYKGQATIYPPQWTHCGTVWDKQAANAVDDLAPKLNPNIQFFSCMKFYSP